MNEEIWKDIAGYEGIYKVSNKGNVFSVKRAKVLKTTLGTKGFNVGYCSIVLSKRRKKKFHNVHRLVLITFNGEPQDKFECNHINGIKTDNRLENLEWVSHQDNIIHAFKNGLCKNHVSFTGGGRNNVKLKDENVKYIKENFIRGKTPARHFAKMFGVHHTTILNIINGKSWTNPLGI